MSYKREFVITVIVVTEFDCIGCYLSMLYIDENFIV
jgi:hypothetical protein